MSKMNGINGISMDRMKVCVIGAGAAGLCAARHLAANKRFVFEMYERTDKVGGTWNYTDNIGVDENGFPIHSSMYKHLRTNLPMEIMAFADYPWQRQKNSFVKHDVVLEYLKDYTKHFDLNRHIKFYHSVISVKRSANEWEVTVKDVKANRLFTKTFDAICVCNGRYSMPGIPETLKEDMKKTKIKIIHSHDYRESKQFMNENVFILGAGPSGIDICLEIAEVAKNVYLCHHLNEQFLDLPRNITQINSPIASIGVKAVKMKNGTEIELDSIVFATGYNYDFTFLDSSCDIKVTKSGRVLHTYLHLINIAHPSMAIWAIPQKILPFPLYNQQVIFFLKSLLKEFTLPSKEAMLDSEESDFCKRTEKGIAERHAHKMFEPFLWELDDQMCSLANMTPISPTVRQIFDHLHELRKQYTSGYKDMNLIINNNNGFAFR
ncbi:Flavin-containing monooxygenase FMO GS-OX-like 2 [Leptotrombidium deliense]|uniref:Flavin-containing monooxygenase n=1 Tax=Leptotrombidium deliense TaxID=299467 RepID=A0A443SAI8_9ACAR|nr:Flavin-containing monooxygenase FMO GS-OX-like 2 [Leptotrombidium deliense]